jgi:hypothetical protein
MKTEKHHLFRLIGFNINGFCSNKNSGKAKDVHNLLEFYKPDAMILAETAINMRSREIIPHDEYKGHISKIDEIDERKARGKGMGIVHKLQYSTHAIPQLAEPKQCAYRIKNQDRQIGFIVGGFHIANANGGVRK